MVVIVGMVVIVVAVADMIVIEMHNDRSFEFFFYYSAGKSVCQNIYFFTKIPREGLRNPLAGSIIVQKYMFGTNKNRSSQKEGVFHAGAYP